MKILLECLESIIVEPRPPPLCQLCDMSALCCSQKHRLPLPQLPIGRLSTWEKQDISLSHPAPSYLLLRLSLECG